jgi:hypothetical protein
MYLIDELHKWNYNTRKSRHQLDSEFRSLDGPHVTNHVKKNLGMHHELINLLTLDFVFVIIHIAPCFLFFVYFDFMFSCCL